MGGVFCITADHGNCDDMVQRDKKTKQPMRDENGALMPLTSHTLAPVRGAPTGEGGRGGGETGSCSQAGSQASTRTRSAAARRCCECSDGRGTWQGDSLRQTPPQQLLQW